MNKSMNIVDRLRIVKQNDSGIITFHFEDGGKQRQPINKAIFIDERGKDLPLEKVAIKINEIAHDLKAKYYVVN